MCRPVDARGFTLIEVTMALVMLAFVVLGLHTATSRFLHTVTLDRVRAEADAEADSRIAQVRLWLDYTGLEAQFADTVAGQPHPGWSVATAVVRVGGPGQPDDYKRVSVRVTAPGLAAPVERTLTVAAP